MQTYKQCKLQKGNFYQTSFIPSKFALINNVIKLKCNEIWEDGWVVIEVGAEVDEDYLPDAHKAIKQHRKNTGDSLKKN